MSATVLLVEDEEDILMMTADELRARDFTVLEARNYDELCEHLRQTKPDLFVLDVMLKNSIDGFAICKKLKANKDTMMIPVMLLTSRGEVESKIKGLGMGADDYLTKPYDVRELVARIESILRIKLLYTEINPLTNLPGNTLIESNLGCLLDAGKQFVVVFADLNNFKAFNDKYGLAAGDKILKFTAMLISDKIDLYGSDDDFVGHIGGDDFVFITSARYAEPVCREITGVFDKNIWTYYAPEDITAGGIQSIDREGRGKFFPFMGIALYGLNVIDPGAVTVDAIMKKSAELKKIVKQNSKSAYSIEPYPPGVSPAS